MSGQMQNYNKRYENSLKKLLSDAKSKLNHNFHTKLTKILERGEYKWEIKLIIQ